MGSWIPALSTALQHSIQNVIFCHFKYGSVDTHGLSAPSSSLVSYFLYCARICARVSVFISATDKVDSKVQRQKGWRLKGERKGHYFWWRSRGRRLVSPNTCRPEIRKWTAGSQAGVKIKASRRRDGCHGWTEQFGGGSTFFSRVSEVHQVMTAVSLTDDSDLFLGKQSMCITWD